MAAAGATCGGGRGEEDVHNVDASERLPRPAPALRTGALPPRTWPWSAPAVPEAGRGRPSARTGALPLGTWPWPAPSAQLRGRARFLPGQFFMPAVKRKN